MLKFISLFAGIGGFDLGFERAGMKCVAQVEIDDYCNRVLAKHWPNVRRFRDVKKVHGVMAHAVKTGTGSRSQKAGRFVGPSVDTGTKCIRQNNGSFGASWLEANGSDGGGTIDQICKRCLPPADLICGGFPCQPHSVAGKRRGAEDDRDLWPEYRRIIADVRPRWVVGENVLGIRTTILDQVLSDLEGMDYATGTLIIPACAFDAPHRRERVFIVAYSENKGIIGRKRIAGNDTGEGGERGTISGRGRVIDASAIVPNPATVRRDRRQDDEGQKAPGRTRVEARGDVSNSINNQGNEAIGPNGRMGRELVAGDDKGFTARGTYWTTEPNVGRVAHGVPSRVDRLRALGNAVVPQVAEFIGRMIVEIDSQL